MKRIIIFIFLFVPAIGMAQSVNLSPLNQTDSSFKQAMLIYGLANIIGKDIYSCDIVAGKDYYVYLQKTDEGLAIALKLISAPLLYSLAKNKPNIITTENGVILIVWYKKRWNLSFDKSNLIISSRPINYARAFSIKRNL